MSRSIWVSPRKDRANEYYLTHKENGRVVAKRATGAFDLDSAKNFEADYRRGLGSEAAGKDVTVLDCVVRYYDDYAKNLSSAEGVRTVMRKLVEGNANRFAKLTLTKFDREAQKGLAASLAEHPNTRRRQFEGVVATAIRWMEEEDHIPRAPKLLTIEERKGKGLPAMKVDHMRKYLEACESDRERRFILLMITTCPRPTQILELTWDRVLADAQCVDYSVPGKEHTYGNKRRAIAPLAPTALRYLEETKRPGETLLIYGGPKRAYRHPEGCECKLCTGVVAKSCKTMSGYRKWLTVVGERAGVPYHPYRLRKGLATWLRAHGVPMWDVKAMLGHSVGGVSDTYAQYDPSYMVAARNAAESLLRAMDVEWLRPYMESRDVLQA